MTRPSISAPFRARDPLRRDWRSSWRANPVLGIWVAGSVLVCLVIATAAWLLWQSYLAERRQAITALGNSALSYGASIDQTFRTYDAFISSAIAHARYDEAGRVTNGQVLQELMATWRRRLGAVDMFAIVGADGRIAVDSETPGGAALVSFAGNPHFEYLRDNAFEDLYFSPPIPSPVSGEKGVMLARRIIAADGRFLGVALQSIRVSGLAPHFIGVDLGTQSSATLVLTNPGRTSGIILTRAPFEERLVGTEVVRAHLTELESTSDHVALLGSGSLDGIQRLVAVRFLDGYPLGVALATAWSDVRDRWYRRLAFIAAATLAAVGFVGFVMFVLARQVGERIDVEMMLAKASIELAEQRQLELETQQSKLDALARLSGGVAHEFSNLLQPIKTLSGIGRAMPCGDRTAAERYSRYFAQIEAAVGHASQVAADFVTFCGSGRRPLQLVDLDTAVRQAIESARCLLAQGDKISMESAPGIAVRIDWLGLTQVLMNLVKNAVEARDAVQTRRPLHIQVSMAGADGRSPIELRLADNGPGMTEAVQARIFEPFFTTKSASGGSGLGMSVVYGIVSHWGGRIEVRSRLGDGAAFLITFPEPLETLPANIEEGSHAAQSATA